MDHFNLNGTGQSDDEAEEFSYEDLLDIAAELQVKVEYTEEAEDILDALDPPPGWEVEEVDSVMGGDFILKLETAPDRPALGKTVLFEDGETAYIVDHEVMYEKLTSGMFAFSPYGSILGDEDETGGDLPSQFIGPPTIL